MAPLTPAELDDLRTLRRLAAGGNYAQAERLEDLQNRERMFGVEGQVTPPMGKLKPIGMFSTT